MPHNAVLRSPLKTYAISLHYAFSRHIAQNFLEIRDLPPVGEVSRSDRGADRQTSITANILCNLTTKFTAHINDIGF